MKEGRPSSDLPESSAEKTDVVKTYATKGNLDGMLHTESNNSKMIIMIIIITVFDFTFYRAISHYIPAL